MQRVVVVGPPGSGKSTLGAEIGRRLGIPHTEMDSLFWEPAWTEADRGIFRERVRAVTAGDRWVIDGNYFSAGAPEIAWPRADTIVWLDFSRRRTLPRLVVRSGKRVAQGTELWESGNRETVSGVLGRDSLLWYALFKHAKYRARYDPLQAKAKAEAGGPTWVRLRSPREVRRWLETL